MQKPILLFLQVNAQKQQKVAVRLIDGTLPLDHDMILKEEQKLSN